MSRKSTTSHKGPPSSRGAAPIDAADIAFLRGLLERKSYSGELLRQRMTPPCSGSVFSRAKRGEKVSLPVQIAMAKLVCELRQETAS
jgi:hypothetical protein